MPVACDRIPSLHLDQTSLEPLIIGPPGKPAVQPGRRNLKRVFGSGHQLFHVEDRAEIMAEALAIFVSHPRQLIEAARRASSASALGRGRTG